MLFPKTLELSYLKSVRMLRKLPHNSTSADAFQLMIRRGAFQLLRSCQDIKFRSMPRYTAKSTPEQG